MNLDLMILGAMLVFGILGMISGAIKQLSHWIGIGLAYALYKPAGAQLAPLAAKLTGLRPMMVGVALSVLVFPVIAIAAALIVSSLLKLALPDRIQQSADRAGGFVLGAGKVAALAFVLLCALVFYEKPLSKVYAGFGKDTRDSKAVALARAHNLFAVAHLPALAGIEKMLDAAKDPASAKAFMQDANFKALMDDPRLKDILGDKSLAEALKSGDAAAAAQSGKLMELLKDPKAAERLSGLENLLKPAKPAD